MSQFTAPPTFHFPAIAKLDAKDSPTPQNLMPKRVDRADYFIDPQRFFGINVTEVTPIVGPHWHPNADEFDYFLEGRGTVTIVGPEMGGKTYTFQVKAGDAIVIPQGFAHSYLNQSKPGRPPLKFLAVFNNSQFRLINSNAIPDPAAPETD